MQKYLVYVVSKARNSVAMERQKQRRWWRGATPPEVSWTGAFAQCCPPSWTLDHELWYKVWCSEEW